MPDYSSIVDIVIQTREIALRHFIPNQKITFKSKEDGTPVSLADIEVNDFLSQNLAKIYPDIAILSEENNDEENRLALQQERCFIIDPIDGTSSFIQGKPEFTVNVALRSSKGLEFGVIYLPVDDVLYYAELFLEGSNCYRINQASVKKDVYKIPPISGNTRSEISVVVTRRKQEFERVKNYFVERNLLVNFLNVSSSAKFCFLCDDRADAYLRMANIKVWDVAAGFALVKSCGFAIEDLQGNDFLEKWFSADGVERLLNNQLDVESFIVIRDKF